MLKGSYKKNAGECVGREGNPLDASVGGINLLATSVGGLKLLATSVGGLKLLATSVGGLNLLATSVGGPTPPRGLKAADWANCLHFFRLHTSADVC